MIKPFLKFFVWVVIGTFVSGGWIVLGLLTLAGFLKVSSILWLLVVVAMVLLPFTISEGKS